MFKPEKIDKLIAARGITKKEFSQKVGISQTTLSDLNKGADIGLKRFLRVAEFFNVPIDYFFDREVLPPISENGKYKDALVEELKAKVEEQEEKIHLLHRENGKLEGKIEMLIGMGPKS